MTMPKITAEQKILLVNTGRDSVRTIRAHLPADTVKDVYSRHLIVHVQAHSKVLCVHRNEALGNTYTHVFIRRRGHDEELCGILAEVYTTKGIPVSDAINLSFINADAKIAQMPRLALAGVAVPESIICTKRSYTSNRDYILSQLQFPLVYKENGRCGEKVFLIHSEDELHKHIDALPLRDTCLLQAQIPNTFDTRTLVAYGTVLGSIKRTAKPGEFHNNVSRGASIEAYTLTETEVAIAQKAAAACKLDFAGVDFIHTPTGPIVLEVNKSPQIKGFETIYGKGAVFTALARIWQDKH